MPQDVRAPRTRRALRATVRCSRAAVLGIPIAVLAGCVQVVGGQATATGPVPTTVGAPPAAVPVGSDAVSAATVAALQEVWRATFPDAFGREWRDIAVFAPTDTEDPAAAAPPCVGRAADLAGQAFYCPAADAVVWDANGLVPELLDRFGPAGVAVVLAHEVGHAVQTRLGIDEEQVRDPARYPTILLEAMADCYAGVAVAQLAQRPVAGVAVGPAERDKALLALVGFRDPLGVEPGDTSAHGNAFDRVSAFQDGYASGAARCSEMSLSNRTFTQRRFGSAADRARGGDLPLTQLLAAVAQDAPSWFTTVGAARAPGWTAPPLSYAPSATGACPPADLAAQGPVRFCSADGSVAVDREELGPLHLQLGDYAGAALVASRYALAAVSAAGERPDGPAAGAASVCLTGAYTARLIDPDGGFTLSPGDLDEAVQVLLAGNWAARDAHGDVDPAESGFERIDRFRAGLFGGPNGCLTGG